MAIELSDKPIEVKFGPGFLETVTLYIDPINCWIEGTVTIDCGYTQHEIEVEGSWPTHKLTQLIYQPGQSDSSLFDVILVHELYQRLLADELVELWLSETYNDPCEE